MNGEPVAAQAGEGTAGGTAAWHVRAATAVSVQAAAEAVGELLIELGGHRPETEELEAEARALVEDPALGVLLVAEAGGELVGVLAAS